MSAADTIRRWRSDPVEFVRANFQVEPDAWQVDALRSLTGGGVTRLCMKACAGPGKTAVLAWIGWWFLSCFGGIGEHPKGAAVATTADNLKDNLWPELAKWQARSPFLSAAFTWQKERIFANDHPETWFISARSFNKSASEQEQGRSLSGLHSEYPFVLIDESGDIAPSLGRAAEQAMGNCKRGLIAQAGNPTSQTGLLYDSAVTNRDRWRIVSITADPDDPKRTPRVDIAWARDQVQRFGRDNPWLMAYVLGLFPPSSFNSLIGASEVEAAHGRHLEAKDYEWAGRAIGVDVARFGDDRTTIWKRQGRVAWPPIVMQNARTDEIAARVATEAAGWADAIFVDGSGGYGGGVVDALRHAGHEPIEVSFSGSASDPRYFNRRSEMWWRMTEWTKGGGCLPPDPELVREMAEPTYWLQNGKLRLEEKEQIKSRLGRSPDKADGLALTFAVEVVKRPDLILPRRSDAGGRGEFDPFRDG